MDVYEAITSRFSCRKYVEKGIERDLILQIAEAGRLAPSGCNSQRWIFIAVDDPEKRGEIADALYDSEMHVNTFAHKIPAFIVIAAHPHREPTEKQKRLLCYHENSQLIDIGIAAENMCLCATGLGLGSIILGWFKRDKVKRALGMPDEIEPTLIVGVGYAEAASGGRTARLDKSEIIRLNSYGQTT